MVANEKAVPEAPKTPKLAARAPGTPKLVKAVDSKPRSMSNGTDNGKVTPKDFKYNPSQGGSLIGRRDFRVQGYADANFEKPRPRQSIEIENPSSQNKTYGVPNWLDTIKPKIYGEVKGLQYGSDAAPETDLNKPKPIRNPFNEKTSAELDKYRRLQMEVDRDIARFREEKMRKIHEREKEKKDDLDMLKNYHPWGKPGGGAPNPFGTDSEHKKQKFPMDGKPVDVYEAEYGSFHKSFGRPGAGAPLRTESGKIKAEMTTAPDIRFQDSQDGKLMLERSLRYKNDDSSKQHYGKALDKQLQEKALNNQELRIQELKKELEMIKHDPFGKPGAGAPNTRRADDGTVNAARRNTLSADVVEMRRIERKERELGLGNKNFDPQPQPQPKQQELAEYDPWGKGYGAPQRDDYGEVRRHRFSDRNYGVFTEDSVNETAKMNSLPLGQSPGGAGAPIKSQDGEIMTRIPITMKRNERGDTSVREEGPMHKTYREPSDPELQVYDPWGRSGAGAPIRDAYGQPVAQFTGQVHTIRGDESADASQRALAKQIYLKELQRGIEEQRAARESQERELKHGGGDLAAVMRQGQVGRPRRDPDTGMLVSQRIMMSDVTRGKADKRTMKDEKSHLYHTELENAAEERRRNRMLDRAKDQQESIHHQSTFDTFWGKPGAGAPNSQGTKKAKLDDILHSPRKDPDDFYSKVVDEQHPPQNYVRSTISSNHVNMFEMSTPKRAEPQPQKPNYNLVTPWASNSEEVY